ncbi:hypothetical protein BT63DRAFT_426818 [Microthyrium microscopicum]|uniref:Uncharacterized protein n=1 Tax=Microthyrium microscopicum TaxID=703497 RepID=A0A6A6U7N1_9PEZI|nr:hypothetical protein BT63DRAFT_426818 [Microthyrium microscopicum]
MKLVLLAFATFAAACAGHQNMKRAENGTLTAGNATLTEVIPPQITPCDCPAVTVPPFLNANAQCAFKANAAEACYLKNPVCPSPIPC